MFCSLKSFGIHKVLWIALTLAGITLLMSPTCVRGKIYLDPITDPDLVPFPIAIADFTSPRRIRGKIAQNIQSVLSSDLVLSGLFRVIESKDFPPDASKKGGLLLSSDFEVWNGSGVDALLAGSFWVSGDSLKGSFRLYDLVEKKFSKGIHYEGKTSEWRSIAHRIANEVVFNITGEKGIFATQIAFVSNKPGNKEIYLIEFDGENLSQVTHNKSINILPRWTPDGKKLLYTSYIKRNPDLYAIDLTSRKNFRVSCRTGINASPTWLFDSEGEKMILMLNHNDRSHLFLTKGGEKQTLRLTSGLDNNTSPSWSPDGERIAFVSDRSGSPQIYTMGVNGKNIKRLTYEGGYNVSPSWSPKGDRIAFCGRQNRSFEIFLITPDGEKLKQLTHQSGNNEDPCWSPDGRYLAFSSTRRGSAAIYVMNANGTNQRKLTDLQGEATNPAWSPYLE